MKHKLLKSCLFLAFTLMTVTTGFSGYQIQEEGPQTTPGNVDENKGTDKDYHKVTFQNSATGKTTTRYYEDGYILSMADLADATSDDPNTMYVSGSQYLSWKAEGGTYAGQALSTHIEVTEDLLLKGTATTYTNTVSASCLGANNTSFSSRTEATYQTTTLQPTYEETLTYGSQFVGAPDNIIRLTSEGYNQTLVTKVMGVEAENNGLNFKNGKYYSTSHADQINDAENKQRGNSINIRLSSASGGHNGYGKLESSSSDKYCSFNGDETIGLSNPEANTTEGGTSVRTDYKYQNGSAKGASDNTSDSGTMTGGNGSSYSINYCVTRLVLQNDIIFSADLTLGGITGYCGYNIDTSQFDYQGFIIGSYCEIDLNGHDLILTSGSELISYGSITDSSRFNASGKYDPNIKNTGSLVLLSQTLLQSPFVFEDHFMPLSAPVSYFNNNSPYNFFRCPYLDCKIIFYPGSHFQGEYNIDMAGIKSGLLGGSLGAGAIGILHFIGTNENDCLINLLSGKIVRDVSYNPAYIAFAKDLFNQEITYSAINANLALENWLFSIDISKPIKFSFSLDSRKYQFFIPFYYRVKLINSTLELNQELVFMAGSSMFVDSDSKIILSYSNILTQEANECIDDKREYQSVGGLTFLDTFYYSENQVGQNKDWPLYAWRPNNELFTDPNYNETSEGKNLWYLLSKTPAYCIFNGSIELKENNRCKQNHPFVFGGQMDILHFKNFKNEVESWNNAVLNNDNLQKVQLYGNYCMLGPNTANTFIGILSGIKQRNNYVRGFYTIPLMTSENIVLVDVGVEDTTYVDQGNSIKCSSGTGISNSLNCVYDSSTGVITNTNDKRTYAFLPNYSWSQSSNDNDENNFYKAYDLNLEDDLAGHFYSVTVENNYVIASGKNGNSPNIFYRGMFVWADSVSGDTASVKLYKFIGAESSAYSSSYNIVFNNTTKQWTYSSKA